MFNSKPQTKGKLDIYKPNYIPSYHLLNKTIDFEKILYSFTFFIYFYTK